jgi:hypothetical protein
VPSRHTRRSHRRLVRPSCPRFQGPHWPWSTARGPVQVRVSWAARSCARARGGWRGRHDLAHRDGDHGDGDGHEAPNEVGRAVAAVRVPFFFFSFVGLRRGCHTVLHRVHASPLPAGRRGWRMALLRRTMKTAIVKPAQRMTMISTANSKACEHERAWSGAARPSGERARLEHSRRAGGSPHR